MMLFCFVYLALLGVAVSQDCTGYENHPLILVSMDGFRAEYLTRGLTPTIQALKDSGTSPPYMKATYPTITFPNHYTIVTGLYPESHGIIANSFYSPEFDEFFSLGTDESLNGHWWGGDPIWNTVVKQGNLSATFFWPGSDAEIEDMRPSYYYKYDGDVPYNDRVDQVLLWLSLPESSRPILTCLYFDEPDHTGHANGTNSTEMNNILGVVDSTIARLVDGIADMNLTDCVNLILLSDHGMTNSGEQRLIELTDYAPDLEEMAYTFGGAFARINVTDEYADQLDEMRENLTCQTPPLRQYSPSGLPTRFHYSNNIRIENIVLDQSLGYRSNEDSTFHLEGEHGYDNYYEDMEPLFIAYGPEFKIGEEIEHFQNIELYNLMCYLVGVTPAPNNGTDSSLNHMLRSPPPYPTLDPEDPPSSPLFPGDDEIYDRQNVSGCDGDPEAPLNLNFSSEAEAELLTQHLPFGIPYFGYFSASSILLYQDDHITGYSQALKMPLWTSFTANGDFVEGSVADWSSDVRLTSTNSPKCEDYEPLAERNVTMQPLFPNRYGEDPVVTFIVSNAIPMADDITARWSYLVNELVLGWFSNWASPTNVIMGPVFDLNADSIVDDVLAMNTYPIVPSHLFLIITRCLSNVSSLSECSPTELDALAFISPQEIDINNCLTMDEFTLEFSSKIKDVEIATGLTFFPTLEYEDRTRLAIRIHSSLWDIYDL